ncbi:hypothetical protein ACWD7C_39210 [Streptomyces sp. NPDC005134]|uniref:hypothetical protein n=1 Tax=unclassified Streptomyces TaxID=2593676 RepID=UPI0033A5F344
MILCDDDGAGTSVPFLRRYSTTSLAGTVTPVDTELDGTTPYTVAGTATLCTPAEPERVPVTPHGTQNTDWSLVANAGTQSVTLLVHTGSVAITTADGALTVPAGTTMSWGVDGDQADSTLTGTLSIDGDPATASWHVLWTVQ